MASQLHYRTQYDVAAAEQLRLETDIHCEDESMTVQDAPDTNINDLMIRFGVKDGSTLPTSLGEIIGPEFYGDFTNMPDLRTALDQTRDAENQFMELPADIRSRFNNDAWRLHDWVTDPRNIDEAVRLGLLSKVAAPVKPAPTPPADPAAA